MKLSSVHCSNPTFHNDGIQQRQHRLYQKKLRFPHSISNYEVSQDCSLYQASVRYPSTPFLGYSRQRYNSNNNLDYKNYDYSVAPIDINDEDYDSDSVSRSSSFRSCLDSINEYSENNIKDLTASSSSSSSSISFITNSFEEIPYNSEFKLEFPHQVTKQTRLSLRYLCIIQ